MSKGMTRRRGWRRQRTWIPATSSRVAAGVVAAPRRGRGGGDDGGGGVTEVGAVREVEAPQHRRGRRPGGGREASCFSPASRLMGYKLGHQMPTGLLSQAIQTKTIC